MDNETSVTDLVLAKFGGVNALARALEKTPSTIQGWKDSGTIPLQHWPAVEQAAFKEGFYDLTARWIGEAHAAQAVRRARDAAPPDDKLSKLGVVS